MLMIVIALLLIAVIWKGSLYWYKEFRDRNRRK